VVNQDSTGMLYFVDRKKDMVRRSGENISSAEVEAVLAIHPMVMRVAIVPVKDEWRDEEVMAVVIPVPGTPVTQATAAELVTYCLRELAYYKAPGWVVFRQELPTTPTNKIQKNLIFEAHQNPLDGAWDCRGMKKRV
jgi:crotonobetaine/carnitine-CoA ligase